MLGISAACLRGAATQWGLADALRDARARAVGGGVADLDFVRGIVIGSAAVGDALVDAVVWGEVAALQRGGGGGGAGEGEAAPAEGAAVRVRMVALVSS